MRLLSKIIMFITKRIEKYLLDINAIQRKENQQLYYLDIIAELKCQHIIGIVNPTPAEALFVDNYRFNHAYLYQSIFSSDICIAAEYEDAYGRMGTGQI